MTGSHSKHSIIPSSEDQACQSSVHEGGVSVGRAYATNQRIPREVQIKWTYFLLGGAILLPWSALAGGTPFFLCRLAGSPFHSTFSSYLATVYMWTKLVFQFYSTFTAKQTSPSRRIYASITLMILLVAALCSSTFIRGPPSIFFAFSLFATASTAAAASFLSTAVYAGGALLGAPFLHSAFSGQAAVGVVVSAVQVASAMIALWGSPPIFLMEVLTGAACGDEQAEEIAARIFFGVSAAFLCIVLVAYTWLSRQSLYKSITGVLVQHRSGVGATDELTQLLAGDRRNSSAGATKHVYQILRQNSIFMFSLTYVFAVTLAVFPAITVRVRPVSVGIHPLLFSSVHFFVFNVGDLLGRYSYLFPWLVVSSGKKILVMSLLRTLFLPLILFCNVERPATTHPIHPIIRSDILYITILATMGYTTGYVSTMALLAVSSLERNPRLKGRREDVDVAGALGGTFIIVGLAAGALSSFGVQAIVDMGS